VQEVGIVPAVAVREATAPVLGFISVTPAVVTAKTFCWPVTRNPVEGPVE